MTAAARISPVGDGKMEPLRESLPVRLAFALGYLFWHLVAIIVVVEFCRQVVMRYAVFFEANQTPIPASTLAMIQFAHAITRTNVAMLLLVLCLDALMLVGLRSLPMRVRWLGTWWFAGVLMAALLFIYFGSLAMGLPMLDKTAG